jgi:5-methylcytosine-specific restriction endonuclease McrA
MRAPATMTDHIFSAASHPELFWKATNHQSLCDGCNAYKAVLEEGGFGRPKVEQRAS